MKKENLIKKNALQFHSKPPKGKIAVSVPKNIFDNMPLAYSPGVAFPCIEINKNKDEAWSYTNIGDSVAIISNGTAVLGLGNLGAIASKPVMEGKSVLFKMAGINCFDIELNETKVDDLFKTISSFAGFGGINLEDIAAPECFELEERLSTAMDIPVFHDDQHGVAIVASAGIKNALELIEKKAEDVKVVVMGAGAAAIASMKMMLKIGIQKKTIVAFDSKGCISKERTDCNKYKMEFAQEKAMTLQEAMKGADIFFGASSGGKLEAELLKEMASDPIIIATANPIPEIDPISAKQARADAIICTGRADFPNFYNQINNFLCFPYIFRVALDLRSKITDEIKLATVEALSALGKAQENYSKDRLLPGGLSPEVRYFLPLMILRKLIEKNPNYQNSLPIEYQNNLNKYGLDYINKLAGYKLSFNIKDDISENIAQDQIEDNYSHKNLYLNFQDNPLMNKFTSLLSYFQEVKNVNFDKLPNSIPDKFIYIFQQNKEYHIVFQNCEIDEELIKVMNPFSITIGRPYELKLSKLLGGIEPQKKNFYYNADADPADLLILSIKLGNLENNL